MHDQATTPQQGASAARPGKQQARMAAARRGLLLGYATALASLAAARARVAGSAAHVGSHIAVGGLCRHPPATLDRLELGRGCILL